MLLFKSQLSVTRFAVSIMSDRVKRHRRNTPDAAKYPASL